MAEHQPAMQRRGAGIGEAELDGAIIGRGLIGPGTGGVEQGQDRQHQETAGHLGEPSRRHDRPAAQQIAGPFGDGDDGGINRAGGDRWDDRGIADMRAHRSRAL